MSYAAERTWIRTRLQTLWVTGSAERTPIAWDNVAFSPPEPPAPWIRPTITAQRAYAAEIGTAGIRRHDGALIVEVFTPAMTGTNENDVLCDAIAALFRDVSESGIRFDQPFVIPIGIRTDTGRVGSEGAWYKQDVICPFERDTIFN